MTNPEPKEENVEATADRPMPDERHEWGEVYDRLAEQVDAENPPSWMPESEGQDLFGQVMAVNPAAPTAYGSAPVVTIRKPNGELASLWLLHTVLRREFAKAAPKIREYVLVRYQGEITPEGGGRPYKSYSVLVDRQEGELDWKAIAERYGDDLAARIDEPRTDAALDSSAPAAAPDDDIPF